MTVGNSEACADIIMVVGGESHQRSSMGSYVKTDTLGGIQHGGRPIYKNSKGSYLYFWSATGNWLVSADYKLDGACLVSSIEEHTWCPSRATGWKLYHDGELHWDSKISVREAVGPPRAAASQSLGPPRTLRCNLADDLANMISAASELPEDPAMEDASQTKVLMLPVEEHARGSDRQSRGLFDTISISPPTLWPNTGCLFNVSEQLLSLSKAASAHPFDSPTSRFAI